MGDAERVLTAALKKNGLDVDALLQRSRIYLASGKLAEAQTDLNQVLHFRNDFGGSPLSSLEGWPGP